MVSRRINWFLIAVFAIAVGHLAWHAVLGPPPSPVYLVGGDVPALAGPATSSKEVYRQLYLRRVLYLSQRPRHAWIQLVGRDQVQAYVNGKLLESWTSAVRTAIPREEPVTQGGGVALVADLTPNLKIGRNVIAISAKQLAAGHTPVVAVAGAYVLSDGEHTFQADSNWRCQTVFERKDYWWFDEEFKDAHWPKARVVSSYLLGKAEGPPRAFTTACRASWITPPSGGRNNAAIRRPFEVAGRPKQSWLRVTATSPYRLAVNGIVLNEQEDQLETRRWLEPIRRIYDITPVVREGHNVVAFLLTTPLSPPHVLAELEVEDHDGRRYRVGTDGQWQGRAGVSADWLSSAVDQPPVWQPCFVEPGDLDIPPWLPRSLVVLYSLPVPVMLSWLAQQLGWMLGIGILTFLACRMAQWGLSALQGQAAGAAARIVYLALIPASLAIAAGVLATFDPRIAPQEIYQVHWLVLALLSVPVQWAFLALVALGRHLPVRVSLSSWADKGKRIGVVGCLVAGLVLIGGWLRTRDMLMRPLTHDETMIYRNTLGFWEWGYPSHKIHEDVPVRDVETSELLYVGPALMALFCDEPLYVVRVPPLCFGIASILLIYLLGRGMFSPAVGLVAAMIYAFAPTCIQMAYYGRYLSQVQFFSMLTVYLYWRTVSGTGPINRRWLWLTAASFVAMYLTWEGSALLAPGMMAAVLVHRRGRLFSVLGDVQVWAALIVSGLAVILQLTHRTLILLEALVYGTGAAEASLMPMWNYPNCELWYYVLAASWNRDFLMPILFGVIGAGLVAIRHRFRDGAGFVLLIFLITGIGMSLLLSLKAWRYAYMLTPLLILLAAVALVAAARYLAQRAATTETPAGWRFFARGIAGLFVTATVILGSGLTLELTELTILRTPGRGMEALAMDALVFSDHHGAVKFVRDHMQEGDAVMADRSHLVHLLMDRQPEYFPQTKLYVQAQLGDSRTMPLHLYGGSEVITSLESLEEVFTRHRRIWYFARPQAHYVQNDDEITAYFLQHMEVVYEDFALVVLFKGDNHRPAMRRWTDAQNLRNAKTNFLR